MQTNSGIGVISNSGGAQDNIAGNINIQGPITLTDVNSAPRWIGVFSTLSGSGAITNAILAIYSANNTSFTGPLIAVYSTGWGNERGTIIVTNEAAMGGNPASFNAAQLELNNGVFNPQGSFALDHSYAGITIDPAGGTFDIPSGLTLTNYEPIAGSGTLTLNDTGTLMHLGSASSFTGTLAVNAGKFIMGASGSLAAANTISPGSGATFDVSATGLSLVSGQTLAGNGTVIGAVSTSSGSKISPGGSGTAATLTISSNLTLSGGATLVCDFLATNDVVAVGGDLSVSGTTSIQLANVPNFGSYPLVKVTGNMTGAAGNFSVSALTTRSRGYSVTFDTGNKQVVLNVISNGPSANLVWQGDAVNGTNNIWDINTTSNWLNGANSDVYFDSDAVNFTDSGATNQPALNVTVNPAAVNFNSSSNYNLTGTGVIAGQTSLTQGGTGALTLSLTNNTYSLGTVVTNGVLQVGINQANNASPLGLPGGATLLVTVSGTGTFNINGDALDAIYTNAIQINGNGFTATQGAVNNNAGGLSSGGGDVGIATLALAGNSTVSAGNNWQIGNTGLGIIGNGYTLTKIGNGSLYLKHAAASALGNLVIAQGGVLFWDNAAAAGATTPITLTNGGFIDTWNPATQYAGLTFNNSIVVNDPVNGGSIVNSRTPYNHPPADVYNGPVTLNGTLTFTNTASVGANQYNNNQNAYGKITMNGNISGTGGILALGNTANYVTNSPFYYGGSLIVLNGNNSYSGPTMVTNLVQLWISTANQSGGSYDIVDMGTLDVTVAAGKPTIPMSSLTLEAQYFAGFPGAGGNLGLTRLAGMPTSPVIYATNLTINPGFIIPPVAGYSVGQFPLVKYDGTIGGMGFDGLTLETCPAA